MNDDQRGEDRVEADGRFIAAGLNWLSSATTGWRNGVMVVPHIAHGRLGRDSHRTGRRSARQAHMTGGSKAFMIARMFQTRFA